MRKSARNASSTVADRTRPIEPPIHRYLPDEPVKPARSGHRRGWREDGLDIHVFKFIYWQDFCFGEGVVGRKRVREREREADA